LPFAPRPDLGSTPEPAGGLLSPETSSRLCPRPRFPHWFRRRSERSAARTSAGSRVGRHIDGSSSSCCVCVVVIARCKHPLLLLLLLRTSPTQALTCTTQHSSVIRRAFGVGMEPRRWLGSRVVCVLDSGTEGPGFKPQPRRCRVTIFGKLFTPIVTLFMHQAAKLVAALLRVAGVTAGLAESNGSLSPGL